MAMRRAAALPGMVAGGRETPRAGGERDVEGETEWANSACDTLEPFRERQPVHRDAGAETTTSRREQQARARPMWRPGREDIGPEQRHRLTWMIRELPRGAFTTETAPLAPPSHRRDGKRRVRGSVRRTVASSEIE